MKIGNHNTARYVWEKFKTPEECSFEYYANATYPGMLDKSMRWENRSV